MAALYDDSSSRNMDGGWMVVGASFMLNFFTNGSTYSFGMIFVELLADFKAGEGVTSYIGSLQASLMYLTGLFVGPFGKTVGWHLLPITGGIITGIGFSLSALAPNIYVLYLTCGVLTGIGNGLMFATSMMCFHGYFNKYRAMASGIIVSGSGLGLMVFSLLSNYLLRHYNLRVTFAVYGAIAFVVGISCGLLLKLPPHKSHKRNSLLIFDEDLQAAFKEQINNSRIDSNSATTKNEKLFYGSIDDSYIDSIETNHEVESIQESEHTHIMASLTLSSGQREKQEKHSEPDKNSCFNLKGVGQAMKKELNFSLLKNPILCLFAVATFSYSFGYHVVYTYTPARVLWFGLSCSKAALLMSVMGVSNIVFRLVTGCIGAKFPGFRFYLVGLSYLSMGVLGMMISLFGSYPAMIVFIVLFGLASGTIPSLSSVVMVDILGAENIEKSIGIISMVAAVAFMIASPIAGLIIQRSGDINLPFEVVGFIGILGAAAYFCILCLIPKVFLFVKNKNLVWFQLCQTLTGFEELLCPLVSLSPALPLGGNLFESMGLAPSEGPYIQADITMHFTC